MLIIANISLLVVALFDLCMMLRYDSLVLHQCEYKNSAYWQRLNDDGEFTSIKRLLAIAVLIGACTTMARMSWMVVVVLTIVLLAQAIVLMRNPHLKQEKSNKRRTRLLIVAALLALVILAIVAYVGSLKGELIAAQSAATTALLVLVASPVLVVLSNWLMHPFERSDNKGEN